MTKSRGAWAILVVIAFTGVATADTYARDKRVAHLAAAMDAFAAMGDAGKRAFEVTLHEKVRATCRPGNRAAPTTCMIAAAREVCAARGAGCTDAADVVITNQHAERSLLDETTRMRLVRESTDYHLAVVAALEARYVVLAAELALMAPEGTLAARIDALCAERDRVVRPCSPAAANAVTPTCVGSIAYQRCAAGLAWFVSTGGAR